ncbi:MAG: nucleotidyltransferase family protein [Bacteroidales bacterium]|nr:nucleotidyltransferase family protein [Bacteroidales bacterium]
MTTALFLALVRSGLYERPLAADALSSASKTTSEEWQAILDVARRQAVLGLLYQALFQLPPEIKPPERFVTELMSDTLRTVRRNYEISSVTDSLTNRLQSAGLSPIVMKGTSVASFYLHPEFRICGDIDLYLPPDEIHRAHAMLEERSTSPDGSLLGRMKGIDIDLHDRYFDLHCAAHKLPAIGTSEATLLMLSAHILKHAIGPGVGLRQLCDMAMAWKVLGSNIDIPALKQVFHRTGTWRWNQLLFSYLAEKLEVSGHPFIGEQVSPKPLEKIILEGGNFGHYASSRGTALSANSRQRKLNTLKRFLRRLPFSLHYAPKETLATMGSLLRGNLRNTFSFTKP